jgi:hypothetical protein
MVTAASRKKSDITYVCYQSQLVSCHNVLCSLKYEYILHTFILNPKLVISTSSSWRQWKRIMTCDDFRKMVYLRVVTSRCRLHDLPYRQHRAVPPDATQHPAARQVLTGRPHSQDCSPPRASAAVYHSSERAPSTAHVLRGRYHASWTERNRTVDAVYNILKYI